MAGPAVIEPSPPATAAGRRARRRRLRAALRGLGWVVVGLLAVVALARLVAWDDLEPLVVANALTPVLYLPAWLVVAVALPARRYALGLVALAVVAAQVAFVLPELAAARPLPGWEASAPSLRLLDANVNDGNRSMSGYARQIRAERPDLVTFEEATPADAAQLAGDGALAGLPYRSEVDRYDPWAFAIASRYRLDPVRVVSLFGRPLVVETVVHGPWGALSLWVVHTVAPLPWSWRQWASQLSLVARLVRRRGPGRLLVVGDLNATWQNAGFRRLLGRGLTDAAAARGDPFAMTWPQGLPVLPPLLRIDHLLAGRAVAVPAIRVQEGPGSDHADELATVAVRPAGGPARGRS